MKSTHENVTYTSMPQTPPDDVVKYAVIDIAHILFSLIGRWTFVQPWASKRESRREPRSRCEAHRATRVIRGACGKAHRSRVIMAETPTDNATDAHLQTERWVPRSIQCMPDPDTKSCTVLGDQHLVRLGPRRHTGTNMHGDAPELIPHHVAFPCVEAGPDLIPTFVRRL